MQTPAKSKAPAMSDDDFLKLCSTETPQKISDAIKNGANVNARSKKGLSALDYTTTNKHIRDSEVFARLQSLTK